MRGVTKGQGDIRQGEWKRNQLYRTQCSPCSTCNTFTFAPTFPFNCLCVLVNLGQKLWQTRNLFINTRSKTWVMQLVFSCQSNARSCLSWGTLHTKWSLQRGEYKNKQFYTIKSLESNAFFLKAFCIAIYIHIMHISVQSRTNNLKKKNNTKKNKFIYVYSSLSQ